MADIRVLEIKESVFADNDRQADALRKEFRQKGTEEFLNIKI